MNVTFPHQEPAIDPPKEDDTDCYECLNEITMDPTRHCFREESATEACDSCGQAATVHTGCDCPQPRIQS